MSVSRESLASVGEEVKHRSIKVNRPNVIIKEILCCSRRKQMYVSNKVHTTKYNLFTFLPVNLMLQFSKMSNLYFLILLIVQVIPMINPDQIPTLALPLSFVVFLSMVKDIYEDLQRYWSDNKENNNKVEIGVKSKDKGIEFQSRRWKQIRVGDIIKIRENQYFPCDMLLINSSGYKGACYVETKNLDGETNLKAKKAPTVCVANSKDEFNLLRNFNNATIQCDPENEFIYKFHGTMYMFELKDSQEEEIYFYTDKTEKDDDTPECGQRNFDNQKIQLDVDNILLRGSSLKNTEWIYGVAIYTGHQTKVMMNSSKNVAKFSKIEKWTNKYITMGILI